MKVSKIVLVSLVVLLGLGLVHPCFAATVFSDGFESGDFSAWTNTGASGGTIIVESVNPHHGTYNAKASTTSYAGCYKNFTGNSIVYLRSYIKITAGLPSSDGERICLNDIQRCGEGDWTNCLEAMIRRTSGVLYWGLIMVVDGYMGVYDASSTPAIALNTWYCVEILRDVTNHGSKLWVDGNLLLDRVDVHVGNSDRVWGGILDKTWATTSTVICDCYVVADTYIGLEGGGNSYSYEFGNTVAVSAGLSGWRALVREGTGGVGVSASFVYLGRETLFVRSEVVAVASPLERLGALLFSFPNVLTIWGDGYFWKEVLFEEAEFLETVSPHSEVEWVTVVPSVVWYANPLYVGVVVFLGFVGFLAAYKVVKVWW